MSFGTLSGGACRRKHGARSNSRGPRVFVDTRRPTAFREALRLGWSNHAAPQALCCRPLSYRGESCLLSSSASLFPRLPPASKSSRASRAPGFFAPPTLGRHNCPIGFHPEPLWLYSLSRSNPLRNQSRKTFRQTKTHENFQEARPRFSSNCPYSLFWQIWHQEILRLGQFASLA